MVRTVGRQARQRLTVRAPTSPYYPNVPSPAQTLVRRVQIWKLTPVPRYISHLVPHLHCHHEGLVKVSGVDHRHG